MDGPRNGRATFLPDLGPALGMREDIDLNVRIVVRLRTRRTRTAQILRETLDRWHDPALARGALTAERDAADLSIWAGERVAATTAGAFALLGLRVGGVRFAYLARGFAGRRPAPAQPRPMQDGAA